MEDAENDEQKENEERDKIDIKGEFSTIWDNLYKLYTRFSEV